MKNEVQMDDFPGNWAMFFTCLILLIVGDIVQALMSTLGVADIIRYIMVGIVGLMVIGMMGVMTARFVRWLKTSLIKKIAILKN